MVFIAPLLVKGGFERRGNDSIQRLTRGMVLFRKPLGHRALSFGRGWLAILISTIDLRSVDRMVVGVTR